ncbi:MAG: dicarboxylate/amino acid:cation symporter [Candidatus Marinimicrobia bacterium]|nr:dicarboxylate/amino acid:cation symporter [Candidatus Neomarinimicrobiota bacterium]
MIKSIIKWYTSTSLLTRLLSGFILGSITGGILWYISIRTGKPVAESVTPYVSPFGSVLIGMLKMIVIPVIFFSLITGAASLPIKRFGRIGLKVIGWYLFCSFLAASLGALLALVINPGSGANLEGWQKMVVTLGTQANEYAAAPTPGGFISILLNMFVNPFEALASNNFLAIITFSILFGLAIRIILESSRDKNRLDTLNQLVQLIEAARDVIFKMVDWILEYSPIGVLALSITNFGLYGPNIVGPYISVTLGVITGILMMVFVVYPILLFAVTRQNPYRIMKGMDEAMITAFITRSSAATLPVSLHTVQEKLKVRSELASFSLPLGATINMDGVCVHLPMFAVLAANMFHIPLTLTGLIVLVITTVLASIGAGGVPGGSIMLLFIILQTMGLDSTQIAVIVALAMGINPILDMFETANNVTGDMVCTYTVAHNEKLIDQQT